jgi:uncharacterized protein YbjT (DUF2867 family)
MDRHILVTGGTGTLGRRLVSLFTAQGRPVRILSRSAHSSSDGVEYVVGDVATASGLVSALAGVTTVVHCAGSAKGDEVKTANLVRAGIEAGTVAHLVYISVVGADRVPVTSAVDRAVFGYFAAKRAAERMIEESGLPYTTLRASQFYDSMLMVVRQLTRSPVVPVTSGIRFQPVDTGEVAQRLAELALGPAAGLVPDLAGPQVESMGELLRGYLRAAGKRRLLLPVLVPGDAARAIRGGANLAPDRAVGVRTWSDFLSATIS